MTWRITHTYPFLFAIIPVLRLVVENPGWMEVDDAAVVVTAVLTACGVVYGLALLATRRRGRRLPPLILLGVVLAFWVYVRVAPLVERRTGWSHPVLSAAVGGGHDRHDLVAGSPAGRARSSGDVSDADQRDVGRLVRGVHRRCSISKRTRRSGKRGCAAAGRADPNSTGREGRSEAGHLPRSSWMSTPTPRSLDGCSGSTITSSWIPCDSWASWCRRSTATIATPFCRCHRCSMHPTSPAFRLSSAGGR